MNARAWAASLLAGGAALALAAVFLGTLHLSRFPHGTVVLPWQFPWWVLAPFVGAGVLLGAAVAVRPAWLWETLLVTAVGAAGVFALRFPILDEWLVGCLAAGALLAVVLRRVPRRTGPIPRAWAVLYALLCVHFLALAVAGLVVWGNAKAVRFVLFFAVVLVIAVLVVGWEFPRPTGRRVTLLIALTAAAYYALYVAHGYLFRDLLFRNGMEGFGGAGSGYHNVIGVVAVPAALLLVGRHRGREAILGWAVLGLALLVTALSDSRGGMLCVFVAFLASPFALGPRVAAVLLALGLVGSVAVGTVAFDRPQWPLDITEAMLRSAQITGGDVTYDYYGREVTVPRGDVGRFLFVEGGIRALAAQPFPLFLTGVGMYGYYRVAAPFLEQIYAEKGVPTSTVNEGSVVGGVVEPPRPPALGALVAESGLIGVALIAACGVLAMRQALRGKGRFRLPDPRIMALAALASAAAWTYFGEAQDIVLFFLLVMPFGVVHQWTEDAA